MTINAEKVVSAKFVGSDIDSNATRPAPTNEIVVETIENATDVVLVTTAQIIENKTPGTTVLRMKPTSAISSNMLLLDFALTYKEEGVIQATITSVTTAGIATAAYELTLMLLGTTLAATPQGIFAAAVVSMGVGLFYSHHLDEKFGDFQNQFDIYIDNNGKYILDTTLSKMNDILSGIATIMGTQKYIEEDLHLENMRVIQQTDNGINTYDVIANSTFKSICVMFNITMEELIKLNPELIGRFAEDGEYALIMPQEKLKIPYGSLELLENRPSFDSGFNSACGAKPIVDPMFLDLNNDGIIGTTDVENGVYFDHEGDGFSELSSWVSKEDGVLVIDKNNDGVISNGNEIFGDNYIKKNGQKASNGFDALKDLDSNNDGIISNLDERFSELKVLKGDGELVSLDDLGIVSINLNKNSVNAVDENGNTLVYGGSFVREDGSVGDLGTFNIQVDKVLSKEVDKVSVSDDVSMLPDVRGYGVVHSLHQAMMRDEVA